MPLTKEEAKRLHDEIGELIARFLETETVPFIEQIRMMFPEKYLRVLKITEECDYIKVMPTQFLGGDDFSKLQAIIKEVHGEYVSQGKTSHFRIKIPKGVQRRLP